MLVVAAIDGSPVAMKVLGRATTQARMLDADLHVVHVFQTPATLYWAEGAVIDETALIDADQKATWEPVTAFLDESGVNWLRVDLLGHPATEIAGHARDLRADLVVIGTRGRGGLSSLVLGSTSQGVIHSAACDVLVVQAHDID